MKVIELFLLQYTKEYDYFNELSNRVANICETMLYRNGIHAVVTYRAKRPDSLREKLIKRNETKHYKSMEQIYQDIADLAGVRIATYFPGDRSEISKLIEAEFITERLKYFPNPESTTALKSHYKRRYAGYDAIHYRVRIKDMKLEDSKKRFAQSQVEIQIASSLMHAWAEVEHDLAYKPKIGSLSVAEYQILDELNGIVLSGENALERLQKSFKSRISQIQHRFNSHYELAALIREKIEMSKPYNTYMGRADILYKFLQKAELDRPQAICRYIEEAGAVKEPKTIVRKLVDLILEEHPEFYSIYVQAKYESFSMTAHLAEEPLPFTQLGNEKLYQFVKQWAELHTAVKTQFERFKLLYEESEEVDVFEGKMLKMLRLIGTADEQIDEARYVYNLRNNVLFAAELPEEEILSNACRYLKKLIALIKAFDKGAR